MGLATDVEELYKAAANYLIPAAEQYRELASEQSDNAMSCGAASSASNMGASINSKWNEVGEHIQAIFNEVGSNLEEGANTLMMVAWHYAETDTESAELLRKEADLSEGEEPPKLTEDGEWK